MRLPPAAAAHVIADTWDRGEAVLPLDPSAPDAVVDAQLRALRPTHLVDDAGRRTLPGGYPARSGTAAVVVTSGTTGAPKGAELGADAVTAAAVSTSAALGAGPGDTWLCCVPPRGVAGLMVLARARQTGLPLVVHDRFDAARVAATLMAGERMLVSLVPTMLRRILDVLPGEVLPGDRPVPGVKSGSGPGVRPLVVLGGAPIPPGLVAEAADRGLHVVSTYGLSETCGGCVLDGQPLPGVKLRIALDGEVLVRGPVVMRGYRGDPTATAAVLRGGWLCTGDLGRLDEDGRLRILGRCRDLVVSGGVNVHPAAVERVLAAHPAVVEAGVAGLPDPEWGERVTAWVVPADPGAPPDLEELRTFARDRLAAAELPRQLVLVDRLPRTDAGKLRRHLLPALLACGRDPGLVC